MENMWSKIISKIGEIEEKNTELINYLSKLSFLSREAMLEKIFKDIITKHPIFKNMGITENEICINSTHDKSIVIQQYISNSILNIKKNPAKKVFYLRKFLDKFSKISDSDKNIVLQSLKNTKLDELEKKMSDLIKIFEIDNFE